jgi:hypothetical protein
MRVPRETAEAYAAGLEGFADRAILSLLAALQLIPENARTILRMECGVQLAARRAPTSGTKDMSRSRLSDWLARSPFSAFEDPLNNLFTDEIAFFGGSYIVFPGPVEDAAFVFRRLARGLFLREDVPDSTAWSQAADLALATLRLSDVIARRAGLQRGIEPVVRGAPTVPNLSMLERLQAAVTFQVVELDDLLIDIGGHETLAPLIYEPDGRGVRDEDYGGAPLAATPLVALGGSEVIVGWPHTLLPALNHALISGFVESGFAAEVADRYRASVFVGVQEDLERFGMHALDVPLPPLPNDPPFVEGVFWFDADKLAHVLLATDDLAEYDRSAIFGRWPVQDLGRLVEARFAEAEEHFYRMRVAPNDVLHLGLLQTVGREYITGFRATPDHLSGKRLLMTAMDLEVISLIEPSDRLALWKYAIASSRIRDYAQVIAFSALDEFNFYRSRKHSYYASDDARPTMLSIAPDGAVALKAEVQRRYDFHGAPSPDASGVLEVVLLHGDRTIPIYAPADSHHIRPRFLVEGWPFPVWVIADQRLPDDRYRLLFLQFVDFVSYWLWQLQRPLQDEDAIADDQPELLITVKVVESERWFSKTASDAVPDPVVIEEVDANVAVTFSPLIMGTVAQPNNAGEREAVRKLAEGLMCHFGRDPSAEVLTRVVDTAAPLGLKKKVTVHDTSDDPRLGAQGLPRVRRVQEPDEAFLLEDLGEHLLRRGFTGGRLSPTEGNRALNESVAYYFDRLKRLVRSLDGSKLLEALVAENEAIVAHEAQRERAVPTEIACFSSVPKMVEDLAREIPESAKTAVASRFLIEYVVAQPPRGIRPLSRAVYDELLALASEIYNKGLLSDFIRNDIGDVRVSMLPSGRLGLALGKKHESGRDEFLALHARSEVQRRTHRFNELWHEPDDARPPELDELEEAVEAEFGFTLTELVHFQIALVNLGSDEDREPKVATLETVIAKVSDELGWPPANVKRALDLHTLGPRADFLAPEGYKRWMVFPWIFNRDLSYIRRPLLLREHDAGTDVVWGIRHVYNASRYFVDLCAGGRLRARTHTMEKVLNKWRAADARAFNDRIAAVFARKDGATVDARVTSFGDLRLERAPGHLITDIDVLVIEPRRRRLSIVETKALAPGRTARELANERNATFLGRGGRRSDIDKLIDASSWVHDHRRQVLEAYGFEAPDASRWRVIPRMVLESELLTPFVTPVAVDVVTLHQLEEEVRAEAETRGKKRTRARGKN